MKFKWQFTRCFEKGYLYILLAGAVFLCFVLNDKIGPLWDWSKEFAYFDYIKTSLVAFHKVPFFVWYPNDNLKDYQQIVSSSIFLANPEPLSFFPLIYLLRYLPPIIFIKIYFFIFFLFGVASCFLLKKRMAWGDKQFRTYLILFLFSPLIIQRLSDGYTSFVNLFLFPLLIYFNLSPKIIPRILGQAGIIGFIVLNSGVHVAVWLFVFLLIQAVCRAVVEKRVMAVLEFAVIAVFVLCLAFIRFYISYKLLGGMRQPLCAGYNPAVFLFWAITPFISVFPFNLMFVHRIIGGVAAWEGSLFMGLALPMFAIMYFHLIKNYKDKNKSVPDNIGILLVVGFLLMLMSMEPLYKSLISFFARFMPVDSLISADKYPFRYMIPSYLLMSLGLAQLIVPVEGYIKNLFVKFSCTKLKRVILKILALISYFICAISALLFTALLFFKNLFINFIAGRVSASYQNQDDWLSLLVQFKAHNLDYYIEKLRSEFAAGTWGFFVLFVFSLLIILLIKHRNRIRDYFVFIPNVFLEFALAIPIFFVCCMWTVVAVSRPYSLYAGVSNFDPKLQAEQGTISEMNFDAQTLNVKFANKGTNSILVQSIHKADRDFITVIPENSEVVSTDNGLYVQVANSDVIKLAPNDKLLNKLRLITLFAWAAFVLLSALYIFITKMIYKNDCPPCQK